MNKYDKVFIFDEINPSWEKNAFTDCIIGKLYSDKRIKKKSIASVSDFFSDGNYDVGGNPEDVFNFDFPLFPDHLKFDLYFKKRRLKGYHNVCGFKKAEKKIYLKLQVSDCDV